MLFNLIILLIGATIVNCAEVKADAAVAIVSPPPPFSLPSNGGNRPGVPMPYINELNGNKSIIPAQPPIPMGAPEVAPQGGRPPMPDNQQMGVIGGPESFGKNSGQFSQMGPGGMRPGGMGNEGMGQQMLPIMNFLRNITNEARTEFFGIIKNKDLKKKDIETQLDQWAAKQSPEIQVHLN